jgi:hypothetical protein
MILTRYISESLESVFGKLPIIKLTLVILPFLMRERLYQSFVTYRIERARGFQPRLGADLEKVIATHSEVYDRRLPTRDKIVHAALKITADLLTFNGDSTDKTDPLSIYQAETVNSTSLASFFTATTQYLLQKNGLSDHYTCQQYIAERRSNGKNLRDRYKSPYGGSMFNLERDIVAIIDLKTGEKRFVDPTIFEQTSIVNIKVEGYANPSVATR